MTESTPSYFYKYRSFSGKDRDRTVVCLEHGCLWFAVPFDFRKEDDYDCNIPSSYRANPETFRAMADSAIIAVMPSLSQAERRALVDAAIEKRVYEDPERIDNLRISHKKQVERRGVLCLCAIGVSDPMWTRYADNHQGCCLQFKRSQRGMFANVERVSYRRRLPVINWIEQPYLEKNNTMMLTKKTKYRFENEWRIWDSRGRGYFKYNTGALTALIFGCQMPEEDKSLLTDLIRRTHPSAKLYDIIKTKERLKMSLRKG